MAPPTLTAIATDISKCSTELEGLLADPEIREDRVKAKLEKLKHLFKKSDERINWLLTRSCSKDDDKTAQQWKKSRDKAVILFGLQVVIDILGEDQSEEIREIIRKLDEKLTTWLERFASSERSEDDGEDGKEECSSIGKPSRRSGKAMSVSRKSRDSLASQLSAYQAQLPSLKTLLDQLHASYEGLKLRFAALGDRPEGSAVRRFLILGTDVQQVIQNITDVRYRDGASREEVREAKDLIAEVRMMMLDAEELLSRTEFQPTVTAHPEKGAGSLVWDDLGIGLQKKSRGSLAGSHGSSASQHVEVMENLVQTVKLMHEEQVRATNFVQPKVDIPKFSGDVTDFIHWRDYMQSAVVETRQVGASKHMLLLSSLFGKAKELVKNVAISDTSYLEILRILEEEYNTPRVVVRELINKMKTGGVLDKHDYEATSGFATILDSVIRALEKRKMYGDLNSVNVIDAALSRLDPGTQIAWFKIRDKEKEKQEKMPVIQQRSELQLLSSYIRQQATYLRQVVKPEESKSTKATIKEEGRRKETGLQAAMENNSKGETSTSHQEGRFVRACSVCGGKHFLWGCEAFKKWKPQLRVSKAKETGACYQCLGFHKRGECRFKGQACKINGCGKPHHILLHGGFIYDDKQGTRIQEVQKCLSGMPTGEKTTTKTATNMSVHTSHVAAIGKKVILGVLKIRVKTPQAEETVGALIDWGGSITSIEESFAKKLGLKFYKKPVEIYGYFNAGTDWVGQVGLEIADQDGKEWFPVTMVTKKKMNLPPVKANWSKWAMDKPEFGDMKVEDIDYKDIRISLGSDYLQLIFPEEGTSIHHSSGVVGFKTKLGWTMIGPINVEDSVSPQVVQQAILFNPEMELELTTLFKDFQAVEKVGTEHSEPYDVKKFFKEQKKKTIHDGKRWVTPMLWKKDKLIPNSEDQARRRLKNLEARLEKNPNLKKLYHQKIEEDVKDERIRKLSDDEEKKLRQGPHYFLPHFPVFHPDKPNKCHRIMDAKAKNDGTSLNCLLETGPNILTNIFDILLGFRCFKIAVHGDVSNFFPSIRVTPADEVMQAFLWRDSPTSKIDVYVNQRHIFGAKCSPAVANFCMKLSAESTTIELVRDSICNDFYVDDYYKSFETVDEARWIIKEVRDAVIRDGFQMGKWIATDPEALTLVGADECSPVVKELTTKEAAMSRVLGIVWNVKTDSFHFSSRRKGGSIITPSQFLAALASVYDPLGFFAPVVFGGKILMTRVWRCVGDWNRSIPAELVKECQRWVEDLDNLKELGINRWFGSDSRSVLWLHVFADASRLGYGAVAYFVFGTPKKTTFVAAKTRIAPTKPISIPRLELMAVVLAFKLASTIIDGLRVLPIVRVTVWTDAKVVLGQIGRPASDFEMFVANRVGWIQEQMDSEKFRSRSIEIRYVPTDVNPADIVSRGVTAIQFCGRFGGWISGPDFLVTDKDFGFKPEMVTGLPDQRSKDQEGEIAAQLVVTGLELLDDARDFQSLELFVRAQAGKSGTTAVELKAVEEDLIRQTQGQFFDSEIKRCRIKGGSVMMRRGPLRSRILFLDSAGILRQQSRLEYAEFIPWDQRHPIVLPGKSNLGKLIIRDAHRKIHHQGVQATRAEIRRRFDLQKAGSIRLEVSRCLECRQRRPIPVAMRQAPLHSNRLAVGEHPFVQTGMDYFGPFPVVGGKAWGLIFICLTSRAIHLEGSKSIDTSHFLLAFERFMARRGNPKKVFSDGGRSFIAGATEIKKMLDLGKIEMEFKGKDIEFFVNPPRSPHWGGSWERAISTVKKCLFMALDGAGSRLSFEVFLTALARVERTLNLRPIGFNDEGNPLCPSQLLNPLSAETTDLPWGLTSMEKLVVLKKVVDLFWQRWKGEYLDSLRADRFFGQGREIQLTVGDKVLVNDSGSNVFTDEWTTGEVVQIFPSKDGCVRSVLVKTPRGEVRRGLNQLAVVEEEILRRQCQVKAPIEDAPLGGSVDAGNDAD